MKPAPGIAMFVVVGLAAAACAPSIEEQEEKGATESALRRESIGQSEMKLLDPPPRGMPTPHVQPDSTWAGIRGKCGPTAVANTLRLYGIEVTPAQADHDGVHWVIGSRDVNIEGYLQEKYPELGCTREQPAFGSAFLHSELDAGHPVMVWFNTPGGLDSHWMTIVGYVGEGDDERVIAMTWDDYYSMPTSRLIEAWRDVYGLRYPAVVCDKKTTKIVR